jgi:signal transduction histidine kinase
MKLKHLSIANKLGSILLVLIILVAVITVISINHYNSIGLTFQKVKDDSVPDLISIFETQNACRRSFISARQFLVTGDSNNVTTFKRNLNNLALWLSKYGQNDSDGRIKDSGIRQMLLTYKTNIQEAGNDIFAKYNKRVILTGELAQINEEFENIFHNRVETVVEKHNEELERAVIEAKNIYAGTILLMTDESELAGKPLTKNVQKLIDHASANLQKYLNSIHKQNYSDTEFAFQKLLDKSAAVIGLSREIYNGETILAKYENEVINTLTKAIIYENEKLSHQTASVERLIKTSKLILLVLSVIFTALALSISHYFSKKIVNSISSLVESTQIMAKGDLSHRTHIISNDEIGALADSFNKMAEELEKQTAWVNDLNKEMIERRSAEEMLKEANQQLAASNRELMMLTQKLEEANHELKDFVYIASHDLREPLRKVTSFGGILKESLEGKLSGDDQENLKFMIDGADRMTKMIEGLLAYSRIGSKEVQTEEIDLNEIVEQLRQIELAKMIEESEATIELPQPLPKIQANAVQIRQLLQNLVGNAIKYRTKDVKPIIIIRAKYTDDGMRIEVQDNGIGIDEKYYEDIFKMFRRLHSRREYEGTGIGLSVCKKIIEKHNGKIGVESKLGQGSTFWFTLPVKQQTESEQKELVSNVSN